MKRSYNEIVNNWYATMKIEFINLMCSKFKTSNLRREDIEDIYQDVFIVINDNLEKGSIQDDTSWKSYIIKIGLNMINKRNRKAGITDSFDVKDDRPGEGYMMMVRVEEAKQLAEAEEHTLYNDEDVLAILNAELCRLSEREQQMLNMHYESGMKDKEIAAAMPNYSSAASVKVVRNRVIAKLTKHMMERLAYAGIIDELPGKKVVAGQKIELLRA